MLRNEIYEVATSETIYFAVVKTHTVQLTRLLLFYLFRSRFIAVKT